MRIYCSNNDPLDFCQDCARCHGPDQRGNCFGYDTDHPDYGGEDYHCDACGKLLETEDN